MQTQLFRSQRIKGEITLGNIINSIHAITRCGRRYREDAFAPMGLKGCHGRYLLEICRNPGIFQEQLTESILVNKSNVARQVAALEEGGFLERRACGKDRRLLRLYPTEKTLALLPQIEEIFRNWEDALLQDLSQEEQDQLEALLQKICHRATAAIAEE